MSSSGRSAARILLPWLANYRLGWLRGDVVAGLTVGVMLIPQSMAYAVLAGAPPIYGLYASLVPLVAYALLGTSLHLAVGITAIDSLIVAAGLAALAAPLGSEYLGYIFLLAVLTGLIQLAMGLARFGFVVALLSRPVISGFTAAAAITIAASQLQNLTGIPLPRSPDLLVLLAEATQHLDRVHPLSMAIGVGAVVLLWLIRRWVPRVPGPIIAVILGTVLVAQLDWQQEGVEVVGAIPTGLPGFQMPALSLGGVRDLFPTALTLALVQFMAVISLGKLFGARHRYEVDANRELVSIGAANVAGGFFQALPISGSFSRTAVGEQAGGRTPMVNVVAAAAIGLTLLFLTPLFYYLPTPVFAAIIIVSVAGLVDVDELRFLFRAKRADGIIAIVTFGATIILGIQQGVLVGIGASMVAILYRIGRPHIAELGHLPGTRSFRELDRHEDARRLTGIYILRVDASFSFSNADYLRDSILERCSDASGIRAVIVDASSINDIDVTAATVIRQVGETLAMRNVEFYFAGLSGHALDVVRRSGLMDKLGADRFFLSPHRAVKAIMQRWGTSEDYLDGVPGESPDFER